MKEVVYTEIEAKSALNRVKGMPFDWSLNPYVGCPHACRYCFSRAYNARYRDRDVGEAFDRNVEVRTNFAGRLRADLRRRPQGSVAIGTATDPYQPIEGKYQLTRRCLEALVDYPMPTSIVTKGPLVVRDIDVLKKLDEKTELTVYFSVPCVNEEIVRKTDPGTAPPRQRLRALRMLREAGIDARPLKIDVEIQGYYYDFLATEFPVAVPLYATLYQGGVLPRRDYERELEERVRRVRARYEFRERPARPARPRAPETVQLQLAI